MAPPVVALPEGSGAADVKARPAVAESPGGSVSTTIRGGMGTTPRWRLPQWALAAAVAASLIGAVGVLYWPLMESGQTPAIDLWQPLRTLAAALGMLLYCRMLGTGRFGASIGALTFAGGVAVTQATGASAGGTIAWLPLVLAGVDLAVARTWQGRAAMRDGMRAALLGTALVLVGALSLFGGQGTALGTPHAAAAWGAQAIQWVFPDFFVTQGQYWGPGALATAPVYAGIAPLLLAPLALLIGRWRAALLFGAVLAVSLALALPSFVAFVLATLAALGGDALSRHLHRRWSTATAVGAGDAWRAAALGVALFLFQAAAIVAPVALALAHVYVAAHKGAGLAWLNGAFTLAASAGSVADQVYARLLASFDVLRAANLRQIALLFASVALLVLWERMRRLGLLWQLLLVGIVAVDVIGYAQRVLQR